jgi:hypothetical protein
MSDIVERLKSPEVFLDQGGMVSLVAYEAADEIATLRGQVEALDIERNRLWTEKLRMQLEITRLQNSLILQELVKNAYYEGWQDSASREYSRQEIQKDWDASEARAALNGEKND